MTGGPIGLTGGADDFFAVNPIPGRALRLGSFSFNQNTLWTIRRADDRDRAVPVRVGSRPQPVGPSAQGGPRGRGRAVARQERVRAKLQAFVLGSVIGGIAGIIFMFDGGFVKPDFFVRRPRSTGTWSSSWAASPPSWALRSGAIVYWFVISVLNSVLTQVIGDGWWIFDTTDTGAIRYVLVGLTIVLLLVFRPRPAGRQGRGGHR